MERDETPSDRIRKPTSTLSGRLATVETRVESLHHGVESLTRAVDHLAEKFSEAGKVSWPLVLTALGACFAAMGVAGSIGYMALKPIENQVAENKKFIDKHQADGHPNTIEKEIQSLRTVRERDRDHERELMDLKVKNGILEAEIRRRKQ